MTEYAIVVRVARTLLERGVPVHKVNAWCRMARRRTYFADVMHRRKKRRCVNPS